MKSCHSTLEIKSSEMVSNPGSPACKTSGLCLWRMMWFHFVCNTLYAMFVFYSGYCCTYCDLHFVGFRHLQTLYFLFAISFSLDITFPSYCSPLSVSLSSFLPLSLFLSLSLSFSFTLFIYLSLSVSLSLCLSLPAVFLQSLYLLSVMSSFLFI